MNIDEIKKLLCENQACWKNGRFTDGGLTVALGSGWCLFMLEEHCANAHNCLGAKPRRGQMCDAIGVHRQASNDLIRIIEAKRGGMASKAMIQLQNGADYLDNALGSTIKARFTVELHTGPGPVNTVRVFNTVELRSRKLRVPVDIKVGS